MTKTIQAALSPLLITGSLCCLCLFEYPLGRVRPYLSCLYFLSIWTLYVYFYYYLLSIPNTSLILMSWTNIIILIASIVSIFVSLFRFQELRICLRKLAIVDDTLEVLGTPKEYHRQLYKWAIGMIIGWIVISCIANILEIFLTDKYLRFDITHIMIPFVDNHFLHINNINVLICGTILGYTGSRFQRINEHIRDLVEDTGGRNAPISVSPCRKETERRQRMWIIMHIHLHLSCISRELNKVFSVQITLDITCLFTVLVELFLYFHESYMDENTNTFYYVIGNLIIYIWAVVFIAKLLALNHICQIVCDKANGTIANLCELSNDDADNDMREQILQFILQINQRQIKFSGMGLFFLGYSFVYKFFMFILTVVVIIVQMRASRYGTHDEANPSAKNKD